MGTKLYRLKHKPTGLYLKNGGKLTEKGHVYASGINTLNCDKNDTIKISLHCSDKNRDKYEAIMEGLYHHYIYKSWAAETVSTDEYSVPKTDFEKEIIAEV